MLYSIFQTYNMAPKRSSKNQEEEEEVNEDSMLFILKDIQLKIKPLENIEKCLHLLEEKFEGLLSKVSKLENDNLKLKTEIQTLKAAVNDREQHHRNSSVRIFGFKLSNEELKDPILTAEAVHQKLLEPILKEAVKKGMLSSVPPSLSLIEFAHILPTRKTKPDGGSDLSPAIILRFSSRFMRLMVFRHKRAFFDINKSMSKVAIVDDLTGLNFKLLKHLQEDSRVSKAWSHGGRLKYTLAKNPDSVKTLRPDGVELPSSLD